MLHRFDFVHPDFLRSSPLLGRNQLRQLFIIIEVDFNGDILIFLHSNNVWRVALRFKLFHPLFAKAVLVSVKPIGFIGSLEWGKMAKADRNLHMNVAVKRCCKWATEELNALDIWYFPYLCQRILIISVPNNVHIVIDGEQSTDQDYEIEQPLQFARNSFKSLPASKCNDVTQWHYDHKKPVFFMWVDWQKENAAGNKEDNFEQFSLLVFWFPVRQVSRRGMDSHILSPFECRVDTQYKHWN